MFYKNFSYYFISFLFLVLPIQANSTPIACPVCAVAIASGLGLSRTLGVKDVVVGVWAGALLLALSHGCVIFIRKKNIKNIIFEILIYVATYSLILPMYIGEKAATVFNLDKIFGIDKFLFSIIVGSVVLFASSKLYFSMKEKSGKPHFPYEKVVLPVTSLLAISILFNFVL